MKSRAQFAHLTRHSLSGSDWSAVGTDEMVKDRIGAYRDAGVTTLTASLRYRAIGRTGLEAPNLMERIEVLGHLTDLVNEVNEEPFSGPW